MTRAAFLLLSLTACGGSLVIPLYDSERVFSRHPGLRGQVVTAEEYQFTENPDREGGEVFILGMVNYEGKIPAERAHDLRQLFAMAGSLSRLACLPQILVIRSAENRVIVCDYYRYLRYGENHSNLKLHPGDIVVVPRIYPDDQIPVAPEWGPVERYLTRRISREELIRKLDR